MVKPVPDGYPQVSPFVVATPAAEAIEFYKEMFGANERFRVPGPDNTISHSELQIGDSLIFVIDENRAEEFHNPHSVGGTPVPLHVYIDGVDSIHQRVKDKELEVFAALEDKYQGDRSFGFTDPFGHRWWVSTHTRDVSPQELEQALG